jgi:hypothetical protein
MTDARLHRRLLLRALRMGAHGQSRIAIAGTTIDAIGRGGGGEARGSRGSPVPERLSAAVPSTGEVDRDRESAPEVRAADRPVDQHGQLHSAAGAVAIAIGAYDGYTTFATEAPSSADALGREQAGDAADAYGGYTHGQSATATLRADTAAAGPASPAVGALTPRDAAGGRADLDALAPADLECASFCPSRPVAADPDDSKELLQAFKSEKLAAERDPDDFNERFQHVFARIEDLKTVVDAFQAHTSVSHDCARLHRSTALVNVLVCRQVVARVLVLQRQRQLPEDKWWIKPQASTGVAGGQKFSLGKVRELSLAHPRAERAAGGCSPSQVFYKFATRAGGLYPTDAAAQKAALEVTAMNAVVGSNNSQISVAVTALYLICGHCVIATAVVPLNAAEAKSAPPTLSSTAQTASAEASAPAAAPADVSAAPAAPDGASVTAATLVPAASSPTAPAPDAAQATGAPKPSTPPAAAETPAPAPAGSLVYGCNNAGHGRDVKDGSANPETTSVIEELAGALGLAAHTVLDGAGKLVTLYLPIDTEAHLGADGRLYLIDLARLLPPVPPPAADRTNSYLYRHFRPEFLRRHQLSLSSDAFSGFAASREPDDAGRCLRAHLSTCRADPPVQCAQRLICCRRSPYRRRLRPSTRRRMIWIPTSL